MISTEKPPLETIISTPFDPNTRIEEGCKCRIDLPFPSLELTIMRTSNTHRASISCEKSILVINARREKQYPTTRYC